MSDPWIAFGPILRFDALRTARRGRFTLHRALYTSLLLVVLFAIYARWFGFDLATGLARITEDQQVPINDQARFAAAFFHTFLAVQLGVMLLLTPAFVGGIIAEEREKGRLNDLLLTDITPPGIIIGKLLARMGLLVLLLLAGVPVLAILLLMGGVDPALLVASFALTLLSMLTLAAFSLYLSVNIPRTGEAIMSGYVGLFLVQLLTGILYIGCLDTIALWSGGFANPLISLNPIGGYIGLVQRSEQGQLAGDLPLFLLGATVLHGLISYFFLHEAIRLFRSDLVSIRPLPPLEASTRPIRPALGDGSPLIWKDTQLEPTTEGQRDTGFFIEFSSIAGFAVAVSFLVAGTVAYALGEHGAQKDIGRVFRTVTLPLIVCVGMLRLTLRGATTISSERERQTLDSLLTTPLSNEEILRGKWLGCLVGQLGLNIIFVLLLVCGLLFWAMPPLGTVLIALDTAALWALVISLGMCVSVSSHSTFRATVTAMVLLLLITAGHWILYPIVSVVLQLLGRSDLMVPLLGFHADALTPPLTLATLSTLGAPEQTSSARLLAACVGVSLHVALAASLWLWLGRRFRLLSGRKE